MISKVINGKEYLFVEAPKSANSFGLGRGIVTMNTFVDFFENDEYKIISLEDEGKFKIIGKANELTEAQWKEISPNYNKNGYYYKFLSTGFVYNAKESGLSLISSLDMKPETTLILFKL